jgi:hypothetical protein
MAVKKQMSDISVRSVHFPYIPKVDASSSIIEAPSVQSLKLLFPGKVLFGKKNLLPFPKY